MSDALRRDLADLATEVRLVDLYERSLVASRRDRRRRLVLATATTMVLLVLAGTAFALLPRLGRPPEPITPSPTASPSPSPSASPSATASPSPGTSTVSNAAPPVGTLGPEETAPAKTVTGLIAFITSEPGPDGRVEIKVNRLANGVRRTNSLGIVAPDSCLAQTVTLSRDGTQLAFVMDGQAGAGFDEHPLYTIDLASRTRRLVSTEVSCTGGSHPMWLSTKDRLRIVRGGTAGAMDLAAGQFFGFGPGYDGYWAQASGGGVSSLGNQVVLASGGVMRAIPPYPDPPAGGITHQGLSPDGKYLVAGPTRTDGHVERGCIGVLDTETGQLVPLSRLIGEAPAGGERLDNVTYFSNGYRVVSTVLENRVIWRLVSSAEVTVERIDDAPTRMRTGQFIFFM